jgi:hypothetical protein
VEEFSGGQPHGQPEPEASRRRLKPLTGKDCTSEILICDVIYIPQLALNMRHWRYSHFINVIDTSMTYLEFQLHKWNATVLN